MKSKDTKYYFGGYYLNILRPKSNGEMKSDIIYTCSECINDPILDVWSYSWTNHNNVHIEEIKLNYQLSDKQIIDIRNWVDSKHNDNKIGWTNVFIDLETALEYKNKFFSHLDNIKIFALYFDNDEKNDIFDEFKQLSEKMVEIGLCLALLKEIEEQNNEEFIGFDYIGVEIDGSFHTFHCHDIANELSNKFNLTINKFGLFESNFNSKKVLDYLNNEEEGCVPVPWFIAKTKLVNI